MLGGVAGTGGRAVTPRGPQAPCRGHLAAALQELRAGLYRSAADIFLPNCDTRGFYRPKQVRGAGGRGRDTLQPLRPRRPRQSGPGAAGAAAPPFPHEVVLGGAAPWRPSRASAPLAGQSPPGRSGPPHPVLPPQCRASQGPKRGQCWCVDRRGHPLAGTEGQGGAARCPPA